MALRIGRVVSDGISLAISRNGALLSVLFFLAESLGVLLVVGVGTTYVPVGMGTSLAPGSEVTAGGELPALTAAAASMLAGVFTSVITVPLSIVAVRTFVGGYTDRIPDAYVFDRIGRATFSAIVASFLQAGVIFAVVFGTVIALFLALFGVGRLGLPDHLSLAALLLGVLVVGVVGAVLLVVVMVHFLFVVHEVAVRNRGVVGAFRGSWDTVRGNRLRLTGLAIVLGGLRGGVSAGAAPPVEGSVSILRLAVTPVAMALTAVVGVVVTAIFARAYRELRPDVSTEFEPAGDSVEPLRE